MCVFSFCLNSAIFFWHDLSVLASCSVPSVITINSGKNCCNSCTVLSFLTSAYFLAGIGIDCFIAGSKYLMSLIHLIYPDQKLFPTCHCCVHSIVHHKFRILSLRDNNRSNLCRPAPTLAAFSFLIDVCLFCGFIVF